eukprot:4598534-Amphidinium_carterae.1
MTRQNHCFGSHFCAEVIPEEKVNWEFGLSLPSRAEELDKTTVKAVLAKLLYDFAAELAFVRYPGSEVRRKRKRMHTTCKRRICHKSSTRRQCALQSRIKDCLIKRYKMSVACYYIGCSKTLACEV